MKLDKKKLNRYQSANDLGQFVSSNLSQTPRNFSRLSKIGQSPIKQEEQNKDINPLISKRLKLQRRLASHQNLTTLRGVNRTLVKQESIGNVSASSSILADVGDEDSLVISKRKSDKISSIYQLRLKDSSNKLLMSSQSRGALGKSVDKEKIIKEVEEDGEFENEMEIMLQTSGASVTPRLNNRAAGRGQKLPSTNNVFKT